MKTFFRLWPRSAFWAIALLTLVFAVMLVGVYTHTRDAYRAVGINDGRIMQGEETLAKIRQSVTIQECPKDKGASNPVEFLSVKADSVHIVTVGDNRVQFCRRK